MTREEKKERILALFKAFKNNGSEEEKKPWKTVDEFVRSVDIIWHTSNYIGKISMIFLVVWPIFLAYLAGFGGGTAVTAFLALLPFLAGVLILSTFPLIDAAVLTDPTGRKIFKWFMAIIGVELAIGIYLSIVPVSKDVGLVPVLVLVFAAILAVSLSGKLKHVRIMLWIILIGLTIVFVRGGREKVFTPPSPPPANQQSKPASYEIKNGYAARKASVPTQQLVEAETSKKILRKGAYVEIETNCVDYLRDIVSVEPGSTVKIMHLNMDHIPRRNRCAMNLAGDAFPISGNGEDTLPWYKENMLHPEFPAYTLVFILRNTDGIVSKNYIRREGGYFLFPNMSGKKAWVDAEYNTPRQTEHREQIGLTGDTATVSFEILE